MVQLKENYKWIFFRLCTISIPNGSIKRDYKNRSNKENGIFQFLMVQLKGLLSKSELIDKNISIPNGSIKRTKTIHR